MSPAATSPEQATAAVQTRLRQILVIVLGLLLLLAATGASWQAQHHLRGQLAKDLAVTLNTVLEANNRLLLAVLHGRQDELRTLAEQPLTRLLVRQLLAERAAHGSLASSPVQEELRRQLAPLLGEQGGADLAVTGRDQVNLFSVGMGPVGAVNAVAERGDYLQKVLAGHGQVIPLLSLPVGEADPRYQPRLLLAAPVPDPQGQVVAALVLALDPALVLSRSMQLDRLGYSGEHYLFDWFGRLIKQTPAEFVSPTAIRLASRGGGGQSGLDLDGYLNHRGVRVVGGWRWDQALGLGLAVEQDVGEAYAAYDQARLMVAWGLVAFVALFLSFWGLMWRQGRLTLALSQDLARANQELSREVGHCQMVQVSLGAGQERYRRLFDNVRDLILVFRLEAGGQPGPIDEVNQAAWELLGYGREEILGRDPRGLLQPLEDHQAIMAKLKDQGQVLLETLLLAKDGSLIPVEVKAHLFELEGQSMVLCLARDLSERRRARQEIREREARLRAIVDGFEGFIYICSDQFRLEFVNERLKRHLGRDPRGEPCHQTIHGSAQPCAWCREGSVRQGLTYRREYLNPLDGRWYYSVTAPLMHPDGRVSHHGMMTDITERKEAEDLLMASEANYRAIFNAMEDAIFVHDPADGAILDANPAAVELFGHSLEQLRGLDVGELSAGEPAHGRAQAQVRMGQALAGTPQRFEWLVKSRGDRRFWVEVSLRLAALGGQDRLLALVRDISQRKESQEQLQLAAKVFENTVEGITVTDSQGNIQMVNPGFSLITGYSPQEVIGQNPRVLRSERHDDEFYQRMWREILARGQWSGEIWNRRKSGEAYPEWLNISAIRDPQGQITHFVAVFHDITEIKASQEQIKYQAFHDALTGLPNRALFNDRLRVALARAQRGQQSLAVTFLDLDHFKSINDSLGHAIGDVLLQEVAARLQQCLRAEDTVSRLGGDEFIMIMPDVQGPDQAVAAAQRIIEALERPFVLKGHELYVTASLGITLFPADGDELETLVKNADMAMYRAKEQGRNTFQLYTSSMNKRVLLRQAMQADLRKALERDELIVYYQPKVDLDSGRVAGMEALLRWQRPDGRLVPPGKFIPLAEDTGLILPIGQVVLEKACRQAAQWARQGHGGLRLAVNLSARQFAQPQLLENVEQVLASSGLAPELLELEITESTVMSNVQSASQVLDLLHGMGVSLALDDFGTGYSSLYYLKHLRIDVLKIDRSFVRDIPDNSEANAIAEAVVSLARSLRLQVVAEGVETHAQLGFLRGLGCDYLQGYLFSRPLSTDDFGALLQEGRSLSFQPEPD
ncbi:MAG: EAL domain-containing protein [Pseudomonadota bacterium]